MTDYAATYDLLKVLAALLTISVIVGGISYSVLKGRFITKGDCDDCHARVCQEMIEIKKTLVAMDQKRQDAIVGNHRKELWLAQSIQKIADKLNCDDIPPMPV